MIDIDFVSQMQRIGKQCIVDALSAEQISVITELYADDEFAIKVLSPSSRPSLFVSIAESVSRKKCVKTKLFFAEEAVKHIKECRNDLDTHFILSRVIPIFYRERDFGKNLDMAKVACVKSIKIAPKAILGFKKDKTMFDRFGIPAHAGYKQLSIILEKEKKYKNAILVCRKALAEGWLGDWQKRIDRMQSKQEKSEK